MAPETGPIFQLERSVITSVLHAVQFDLFFDRNCILFIRNFSHPSRYPRVQTLLHVPTRFTQIHGGVHTHTNTPKSDVPRQTTFLSFSIAGLSPHSTTPPCHSSRDQVNLFALLVVFKLFCFHTINHPHTHAHTLRHTFTYIHTYTHIFPRAFQFPAA